MRMRILLLMRTYLCRARAVWYKHNKSCDSTCFEIKCCELDLPVLIV